jgi:hypothetical protein
VDTAKKHESWNSATSDKPISPFLQYLLHQRDVKEKEKPVEEGAPRKSINEPIFSPSDFEPGSSKFQPAKLATPMSDNQHIAISEEIKDSALKRLRGQLDNEIQQLDRVLDLDKAPMDLDSVAELTRSEMAYKRKANSIVTPEKEKPALVQTSGPASVVKAIDPTAPKSLAPGWTVRVASTQAEQSQTEYKTMFVPQNASTIEVLVMALKKWYV